MHLRATAWNRATVAVADNCPVLPFEQFHCETFGLELDCVKRDFCRRCVATESDQRIYLRVNPMIPLRNFGKTDVKISALGLGGHHLGAAKDEQLQ